MNILLKSIVFSLVNIEFHYERRCLNTGDIYIYQFETIYAITTG